MLFSAPHRTAPKHSASAGSSVWREEQRRGEKKRSFLCAILGSEGERLLERAEEIELLHWRSQRNESDDEMRVTDVRLMITVSLACILIPNKS